MRHESVCKPFQQPTFTSIIDIKKTTAWGESGFPSEFLGRLEDETGASAIPDIFDAVPGIDRRESETSALILTSDYPVNGYTCFLSLSDRVQREKGAFFLQPHTTEVVWGGRKVVFIFQHHSGRFGLYYDILCPALVGTASGGGPGSHRLFSRKAARLFQSQTRSQMISCRSQARESGWKYAAKFSIWESWTIWLRRCW